MTPYERLLLQLKMSQSSIALDWAQLVDPSALSPEEAGKVREAVRVMQETLAQIAKQLEER
jgi:hypothetical protein